MGEADLVINTVYQSQEQHCKKLRTLKSLEGNTVSCHNGNYIPKVWEHQINKYGIVDPGRNMYLYIYVSHIDYNLRS